MTTTISRAAIEPQAWICSGVPSDVIDTQGASQLFTGDFIKNTDTNDNYEVLTCTPDEENYGVYTGVTYQLSITSNNIFSVPQETRSRTQVSSPALNTSYQPDSSRDTEVNINILFSAALSLNSLIEVQTSPDNFSWTTILKIKRQFTLASTIIDTATLTIPAGQYFKIVETGSGASIDSIFYLQL